MPDSPIPTICKNWPIPKNRYVERRIRVQGSDGSSEAGGVGDTLVQRMHPMTRKDKLSPERRSWNMSRIPSRDTAPEIRVKSALNRLRYRTQVHRSDLSGTPDIVLPRRRTAFFVHGCFWHRHANCPKSTIPTENRKKWLAKFDANVRRDRRQRRKLTKSGWNVIVIWECQTEDERLLRRRLIRRLAKIGATSRRI